MAKRQLKLALSALLTYLSLALPLIAAAPLTVKTEKGKVKGTAIADGKVIAFRGIPFAAPPVGKLRWQPPQPAAAWSMTLDAKDFGNRCMQSSGGDYQFHDAGPSEDCLTLNVWTPAGAKPGKLPVMVWIYGGGYTGGSSSEGRQDGQSLAHRNVVIVSMNYRLGIFGFFAHPELTAESPHHASGNYGLLDQAAAIAWVHQNIAAFGGDPKNITIFGESVGSISVSAQMAAPMTRTLIAKAIGESGGAFSAGATLNFGPLAAAEQRGIAFAQNAFGAANLADLRKLAAEDILKATQAKTAPPPPRFSPIVDGYFLPDTPAHIYAAGQQAHIPLLAGWNHDETRARITLAKVKPTPDSFTAEARKDFGPNADGFLAVYPATTDVEALTSAGDFASDQFIVFGTWRWLESQSVAAPTYRYSFDLGAPADKFHQAGFGAFHSDEIDYVFGAFGARPDATWRPEDHAVSDQMGAYWTNFARTGNPNSTGLPNWPLYAPTAWQVMHLDATSAATPDAQRKRYLFLNTVWAKP